MSGKKGFYFGGIMKKKLYTDELLKKWGQKAIDDAITKIKGIIDVQEIENDLMASALMRRYFVSLVGNKVRVIDKNDPAYLHMDSATAQEYFLPYKTTNREIIKVEENEKGKLRIITKEVKTDVFNKWFATTERYGGLVMRPDLPSGKCRIGKFIYYNTWSGWAVKPCETGDCDLFLDFIYEDICAGNADYYDWILDFYADILQNPTLKHPKVFTLRGKPGAGKNTLTETMIHLMGDKYAVMVDTDVLSNHFNSILYGKIYIVADEAVWSGERKMWNDLKRLTGGTKLTIESKGKDKFVADNYMRLNITTNEKFAAPKEEGDRRYEIFTTSTKHLGDVDYWDAIREQLMNGGYEKLMYILLNRKISTNFHSSKLITANTQGQIECRLESLSSENSVAKWLFKCWEGDASRQANLFSEWNFVNPETARNAEQGWVSGRALYSRYVNWVEESGEYKKLSETSFGIKMQEFAEKKRANGTKYLIDTGMIKQKLEAFLGFSIESNPSILDESADDLSA
jgi:hypothetical protein